MRNIYRSRNVVIILLFSILGPTLTILGSKLNISELIAICLIPLVLGSKEPILTRLHRSYWGYFIAYLLLCMFSYVMSDTLFSTSNIYTARKILQGVIYYMYFSKYFEYRIVNNISFAKARKIIYLFILVTFIPVFISLLQLGIGDFKLLSYDFFKPTYYFDTEVLGTGQRFDINPNWDYRVTSVFKDFFTGSVYFLVLELFFLHFLMVFEKRHTYRYILIGGIILLLPIQFITARTGLLLYPSVFFIYLFFGWLRKEFKLIYLIRFLTISMTIGVVVLGLYFSYMSEMEEFAWASEIFFLFSGDSDNISSLSSTVNNNNMFYDFLVDNPSSWIIPHHNYSGGYVYNNIKHTTDNFYLQELYRFGIWGWFALLIFSYKVVNKSKWEVFTLSFVFLLLIANYKGGNTFFMDRNVVFYALLLSSANFMKTIKTVKSKLLKNSYYNLHG